LSGRCLPIRFCLERLAEDENRSCIQMEEGGERVQRDSPRKTGEERAGPFDLQHAFACSHPRAFTIRDGMLADFIISPARAKNHGPRKARKGCRAVPSLCLRAIADSSISCGWADACFQHQRVDLLAVPAGSGNPSVFAWREGKAISWVLQMVLRGKVTIVGFIQQRDSQNPFYSQ